MFLLFLLDLVIFHPVGEKYKKGIMTKMVVTIWQKKSAEMQKKSNKNPQKNDKFLSKKTLTFAC